jgi:putative ABC transport system substrate-binding protein
MRRREFIKALAGSAVARPLAARAQQPDRMRRIGWLDNGQPDDPAVQARTAAVRQELERLGWVIGRNLTIEHRWGVVSFELAQQLGSF